MEILEKLLESGATVDFQDRVSEMAGIEWKAGGGPSTNKPASLQAWDTDGLHRARSHLQWVVGQAPTPPCACCASSLDKRGPAGSSASQECPYPSPAPPLGLSPCPHGEASFFPSSWTAQPCTGPAAGATWRW